jgi:transketolase
MRQTALDVVTEVARRDRRIVFIGSDLGAGTMDKFREEMPKRFFMEGVSEQNIIGVAAGLAMEGFIPFVNTIATFLTRRCFEQLAVDLCLHNLPVRLIANGGGVVYAPLGPTHLAIEDMAILRTLPNMTVIAPSDAKEMRTAVLATIDYPGPVYIRLGKGGDPVVAQDGENFAIGKAIVKRPAGEVGIISTGVMTERCIKAAENLTKSGISAGVLHCHTVKPLDARAVCGFGKDSRLLVTVEEHLLTGGLGSAVVDALLEAGQVIPPVLRLSLPDQFPANYGSQDDLLELAGLQPQTIARRVAERLKAIGT